MQPDQTLIACPLCGLAHRQGATVCDGCHHPLNQPLDKKARQQQLRQSKIGMFGGAALVALMLLANVVWFGGAGGILLVAPLGWLVISATRYRALTRVQ